MPNRVRKSAINKIRFIQVVHVESVTGRGTEADPVRRIDELYDMKGNLITRVDPHAKELENGVKARVIPVPDLKDEAITIMSVESTYSRTGDQVLLIKYILNGESLSMEVKIKGIIKHMLLRGDR